MFDIKLIRDDPESFDALMALRKVAPCAEEILKLDLYRRKAQTEAQELQTRRNELSKIIGVKKSNGEDISAELKEVSESKKAQTNAENIVKKTHEDLNKALSVLPNIPASDVPSGLTEDDNVEIRSWGQPSNLLINAKEHFEIGEALGQMDFEVASNMSGARFVTLSGSLAKMERALTSFMLDIHTNENGFKEISVPLLVRDKALFGTGQLPKFEDDLFKTSSELYLIPTAEVPLANLVSNLIVDKQDLPLRYTASTPCFRSEAGSAGKDTRGMMRQHQFSKVEMVAVTTPENSENEHERMLNCAEEILRRLELPFRVVKLCLGDLGFSAQKTYDIEVWLEGQKRYREISSVSNCGDFQSRRMNSRFRSNTSKTPLYTHTLNGSGIAVGRTMIAIMENYQQSNGSIIIPTALQPYMGGLQVISKNG